MRPVRYYDQPMRKYLIILGLVAVLLAACTNQGTSAQPTPGSTTTLPASSTATASSSASATPSATATITVTATATASPTATPTGDATAVAELLKSRIPSITKVTTVTAALDSNKLLGRPGQYTSAAWITDNRGQAGATGIDGGAVVEIFATAADAKARSDYIQATLKSLGPSAGTEWHHLSGPTLLRVSGKLPPAANDEYTKAFAL